MDQKNDREVRPIVGIATDGHDAAIVSGLFLLTFVLLTISSGNVGYAVGSMLIPSILFVIGFQIAKRVLHSLRDLRVAYVMLFLVLFFGSSLYR